MNHRAFEDALIRITNARDNAGRLIRLVPFTFTAQLPFNVTPDRWFMDIKKTLQQMVLELEPDTQFIRFGAVDDPVKTCGPENHFKNLRLLVDALEAWYEP